METPGLFVIWSTRWDSLFSLVVAGSWQWFPLLRPPRDLSQHTGRDVVGIRAVEKPPWARRKLRMCLYVVFAFPQRRTHGTWTPEPSRPMPGARGVGEAPGRLQLVHGVRWPAAQLAAGAFLSGFCRHSVPSSVRAEKQTEQQMLYEILGLEIFFF